MRCQQQSFLADLLDDGGVSLAFFRQLCEVFDEVRRVTTCMILRSGIVDSSQIDGVTQALGVAPFVVDHSDFSPFKDEFTYWLRGVVQWPAQSSFMCHVSGPQRVSPPKDLPQSSAKCMPPKRLVSRVVDRDRSYYPGKACAPWKNVVVRSNAARSAPGLGQARLFHAVEIERAIGYPGKNRISADSVNY